MSEVFMFKLLIFPLGYFILGLRTFRFSPSNFLVLLSLGSLNETFEAVVFCH